MITKLTRIYHPKYITMTHSTRRTFLQTTASGVTAMALSPLLHPLLASPLKNAATVAVVGVGRQGRAILAELQKMDNITIAAICDVDESRLNSGLRRAQGAKGYADFESLLDEQSDINVVFIATPTHLHKDIAIAAMQAGKHVYCESPLAHTIEDCRAIVQAARDADTIFHTGMQGRSNPIYKLAWSFVRSGSIRDMVTMRGQHFKKTSWRTPSNDPARQKALNWRLDPEVSTGLMGEWGTQQFDVFHYYTKSYPKTIRGGGSIQMHKDGREINDTVWCNMVFPDESVLQYQASLANSYEDTSELFFGTMGTVKLIWTHGWLFKEADAPTQGWEVYANRQQFHNEEGITLIADATQLASQGKLKEGIGLPNDSLYYSIEDFLRSVDENKPAVVSADEGMRAAVVGILANQAVLTGEEQVIDESILKL